MCMDMEEEGSLASAISKSSSKPKLEVSVRMTESYPEDKKWRKKDLERLRKEVKATEEMIKNWDGEEVAKKALASLKTDLAVKKARLMESEALYGDGE